MIEYKFGEDRPRIRFHPADLDALAEFKKTAIMQPEIIELAIQGGEYRQSGLFVNIKDQRISYTETAPGVFDFKIEFKGVLKK